jgi:DNA polymerase III delta prime subunit
MAWGKFKVVLLDEADYLSQSAQAAFRGVMEEYADSVRFILTCNRPNMIIPAIHSRSQVIYLDIMDETEFAVRLAEILIAEEKEFDISILDNYVRATYPDLRKAINSIQLNSATGQLIMPDDTDVSNDWRIYAIALFREKKYTEARKYIIDNIRQDEYVEFFRFIFNNLEFYGSTDEEQDEAVLIIRKGLVQHSQCADPEINLAATMIELEQLVK